MATKKSSSASRKKAAPKKKSAPVKKSAVVEQQETAVVQEVASAPLETKTETPVTSTEEKGGNLLYLFLVIAGLLVLAYLVYNQAQTKKAEATPTSETVAESAEETKSADSASPSSLEVPAATPAVETAAPAESSENLLVSASEIGKKLTLKEAEKFCKDKGASLPSKMDLTAYDKSGNASEEVKKSKVRFWVSEAQSAGKKQLAFSFKDDSAKATAVTEKLNVICKK